MDSASVPRLVQRCPFEVWCRPLRSGATLCHALHLLRVNPPKSPFHSKADRVSPLKPPALPVIQNFLIRFEAAGCSLAVCPRATSAVGIIQRRASVGPGKRACGAVVMAIVLPKFPVSPFKIMLLLLCNSIFFI
jgi:hypothetical protein